MTVYADVVLIHKGFKYRIYPSEDQAARLRRWDGALRFLWNIALEQWHICCSSRAKCDRKYPRAIQQLFELKDVREAIDWLADVPRNVCNQVIIQLDLAWQRCFKGIADPPKWKRKGRSKLSLTEPHPKVWRLDGNTLRFPKLGNVPVRLHRPLEGTPKSCTISREVDQWFCSIMCEVEVPDPTPNPGPPIGIDVGVVNLFACSEGSVVPNPQHLQRAQTQLAREQRVVARRRKGSKNQARAKARVAKLHRKIRRQREHTLHVETTRIAKNHGRVFVEDLNVKGMSASASGTVEQPGTCVRVKSNLNRGILDSGWGMARWMLDYKTLWHGGKLVAVPAAGSSQTCSVCGKRDASSRVSRDLFCCTGCGHSEPADTNASKVIKQRGLAVETTVTGCGGAAAGRPKKQQLHVVRRRTRSSQGLDPLLLSDKAPAFRPG